MENKSKNPLSHAQMALAITGVLTTSALPLYLAVAKNNPLPCVIVFIAAQAYLVHRRRQLNK